MALPSVPFLRTPPECFENLPNFPYRPQYLLYGNLRMAYIDERTDDEASDTFLCLHGQPTWSFLYRKMIPALLNYTTKRSSKPSRRVVVPDLFGFGRSDKPLRDEDYTYDFHRNSLLHLIRTLELKDITLVVQDWGGLLGLTLPLAELSRFKRLIVMNTSIAAGQKPTQGFLDWKEFNNRFPDLKIGALIGRGAKQLSKAEMDAYDAPYPNKEFKGGVRRFPNLVMVSEDMEGADVSKRSIQMYKTQNFFKANDIFMACGMKDPVLGPAVMKNMAKMWKNGCFFAEIHEAGHFVQEWGDRVAKLAIAAFEGAAPVECVKRVEPKEERL